MNSFADYEAINYVKPRGLVNWIMTCRPEEMVTRPEGFFDVGTRIDTAIAKMYNGDSLDIARARVPNPRHIDLNLFDSRVEAYQRMHFYPLIFIPLTTKLYSTVNGFTDEVIKKGKSLLQEAREIFLIGYGAQDDIIKEMFRVITPQRPKTKLHVVGISDSDKIMGDALRLSEHLEAGNTYRAGFMTFADSYKTSMSPNHSA